VGVGDLRAWNKLGARSAVKKGQSLVLKGSATASTNIAEKAAPKKDTKKWITYKVRKGDTMGKIADAFDVKVSELRSWNKRAKSVKQGQSLKVYASAEPQAEEDLSDGDDTAEGTPRTHTVRAGETLYSISKLYGTTPAKLTAWNNGEKSIQTGQTLKVYGVNKTEAKGDTFTAPQKKSERTVVYRVKKRDTLSSIATKYGVTVAELKQENNLRSNAVKVGAKLVIPN
jgi:LysM repeat protein